MNKEFYLESDKKNIFKLIISIEENKLILVAKNEEKLVQKIYDNSLTLEEMQNQKLFNEYETIEEIFETINDYISISYNFNLYPFIIEETNQIYLIIPYKLGKIKEIKFVLFEKEKNINEIINEIIYKINNLENNNDINKINEQIIDIKKNINNIKNKYEQYENENNNKFKDLEKKYDELKNEFNLYKKENQKNLNNIFEIINKNYKNDKIDKIPKIINDNLYNNFKCLNFVNKDEYELIYNWFDNNNNIKFNLLYKATKDGDDTKYFHKNCDNKGATITFIKTDKGRIGGYTSISFKQNLEWDNDQNAFIFNLDNKKKYEIKNKKNDCIIWQAPKLGPCFGCYAIIIENNCLSNNISYCDSVDFNFIDNLNLFEETGKTKFKVIDYEVYSIKL